MRKALSTVLLVIAAFVAVPALANPVAASPAGVVELALPADIPLCC
ncbi:hypothetical protein [Kitasatospora sp. P5_F3]